MQINQTKLVQVNAKTLSICVKCSDMFGARLLDDAGTELAEYDGYVPGFMPGDHYGDYVMLDIDLDTGQIINWKVPTAEQIEAFIAKSNKADDAR